MALEAMLTSQIISSIVLFWSTLFVGLCPSLIGNWFKKRQQKMKKTKSKTSGTGSKSIAGGHNHNIITTAADPVNPGSSHLVPGYGGHGHDDHERNFSATIKNVVKKTGSKSHQQQEELFQQQQGHGHSHHHHHHVQGQQDHHYHDHHDVEQLRPSNIHGDNYEGGNEMEGKIRNLILWNKLLSILMNFGGGVLLATSFLHMLPEINEMNDSHNNQIPGSNHGITTTADNSNSSVGHGFSGGSNETNHGTNQTKHIHVHDEHEITEFPSPQLLICTGFFLIYFVEELMHLLLSHPGHTHSHEVIDHTIASQYYHNHHQHEHVPSRRSSRRERSSYGSVFRKQSADIDAMIPNISKVMNIVDHGNVVDDKTISKTLTEEDTTDENTKLIETTGSRIEIIDHQISEEDKIESTDSDVSIYSASIFKCIILVFALSFHSIFDGLAIGLQGDVPSLIQLSFAILVHKLPIAFVVGLDVYSKTNSTKIVFYHMFPFSLMSPIGIMIAAAAFIISTEIIAILTALSTGSLIYIAFFEILLREKMESKLSGFTQFVSVLIGFIFMAIILQFTGSHHH